MVASLAPGRLSRPDQPPKGSLRVIQSSAVTAKTHITRRCAASQGSLSGRLAVIEPVNLRVSHHMAIGSSTSTTGSPQRIQPRKLTSSPLSSV